MSQWKKSIRNELYHVVQKWRGSRLYDRIDRHFSNQARKRLKVEEFSILCSNCIGGTIYHRYGKQFRSPTINLNITQPEFAQFCLHLDYYLAQPLRFLDEETPYPCAKLSGNGAELPDVHIAFNHYPDPQTAEAKWEERKKRIDFDRLYIILYNRDEITLEDIRALESVPCRNKVIFTALPLPEVSWSYYIKPRLSQQYPFAYLGRDLLGRRYYEKKFDVSAFLNRDASRM